MSFSLEARLVGDVLSARMSLMHNELLPGGEVVVRCTFSFSLEVRGLFVKRLSHVSSS